MPNEPYVKQIMVADGDGDNPDVEEVKYETIPTGDNVIGIKGDSESTYRSGNVNITEDNIVGTDDNTDIADSDLIITKQNSDSKWYRKTFSKLTEYIKTKLGISDQGSTGKYLNEQGGWATPPNTTYAAMSSSELSTGTATTLRTMRADYAKDGIKQLMLDMCYPVGSIYISTKNVSPATFLGGTWKSKSGYMLRGATSSVTFNSDTNDGGADSVTVSSVASHNHTQDSHNHTQDSHNHTQDSHSHGTPNYIRDATAYNYAIPLNISGNGTYAKTYYSNNTDGKTATNQAKTATNQAKTATNQSKGSSYSVATLPKYKNVYMWERTA